MKLAVLSLCALTVSLSSFAKPVPKYENIQGLLEGRESMTSLMEITESGLNAGSTSLDLWSGSYWPHFQGSLAARYREPEFAKIVKEEVQYKKNKEHFDKKPTFAFTNTDNLSPAEKYDLLVGDNNMTLTKYSWEIGKKVAKGDKVATWRGLCDGWASAAQMMPRPLKVVSLASPSGQMINFFPEDIKALGTLLYARAQQNPIFMGKRCYSAMLSFTSMCDEVNPGAFHLALVNRIGMMKKSFIGDVSPGGEVWNYPIKSYSVSFYNIFDEEDKSDDFRSVMEAFDKKAKNVKFYKEGSRHKATAYIVGVKAKVTYQNMREKNLVDENGNAADTDMVREYEYDLELDSAFNILGGESMNGDLPDFMWAPNDGTYPKSIAEIQNPSSKETAQLAPIASKEGQPLSYVLKELFDASR